MHAGHLHTCMHAFPYIYTEYTCHTVTHVCTYICNVYRCMYIFANVCMVSRSPCIKHINSHTVFSILSPYSTVGSVGTAKLICRAVKRGK